MWITRSALISMGLFLLFATMTPAGTSRLAEDRQSVLELAEEAIGGQKTLRDIRSLSLDATLQWVTGAQAQPESEGFDLLYPRLFRWRTATITHTIEGDDFRQSKDTPPALRVLARTNASRQLGIMSAIFLLRPAAGLAGSVVPRASLHKDPSANDTLLFSGPDGFTFGLSLDKRSHLPVGYSYELQRRSSTGAISDVVPVHGRIVSRQVQFGISFPKEIEQDTGTAKSLLKVSRIAVNSLSPESFK